MLSLVTFSPLTQPVLAIDELERGDATPFSLQAIQAEQRLRKAQLQHFESLRVMENIVIVLCVALALMIAVVVDSDPLRIAASIGLALFVYFVLPRWRQDGDEVTSSRQMETLLTDRISDAEFVSDQVDDLRLQQAVLKNTGVRSYLEKLVGQGRPLVREELEALIEFAGSDVSGPRQSEEGISRLGYPVAGG